MFLNLLGSVSAGPGAATLPWSFPLVMWLGFFPSVPRWGVEVSPAKKCACGPPRDFATPVTLDFSGFPQSFVVFVPSLLTSCTRTILLDVASWVPGWFFSPVPSLLSKPPFSVFGAHPGQVHGKFSPPSVPAGEWLCCFCLVRFCNGILFFFRRLRLPVVNQKGAWRVGTYRRSCSPP